MEVPRGKIDEPPERASLSSSLPDRMTILLRLALLAASLSALGCPGSGNRKSGANPDGNSSLADASHVAADVGDGGSSMDASNEITIAVIDGGSVMDVAVADASDACDVGDGTLLWPDGGDAGDGKVSRAHCFNGDGKEGVDAGDRD